MHAAAKVIWLLTSSLVGLFALLISDSAASGLGYGLGAVIVWSGLYWSIAAIIRWLWALLFPKAE